MIELSRRSIAAFAVMVLAHVSTSVGREVPFPSASPAEVGMSAEALELLGERVQGFVEKEAVVGAELHVIKDRKTVFRSAFGWADRDEKRAMETDAIFCVRSMTKPLVGTAIQMLIDDNKLTLKQQVAEILKEFDKPDLKDITIEHLLTHRSGLPMTAIRKPLSEYATLRDVAADAAKVGIDFEPGTSFQYSDAGADTLGAIVAAVTGQQAEDFIRDRILKPTGMDETITLLRQDPRRMRIPSAYSGGTGNWQRHWKSSGPPIFPIFLTSQSLYSTTTDYARFMALWMDGGNIGVRRLISKEAWSRALAKGSAMRGYPAGFDELALSYGHQWMVYHDKDSHEPIVFGHNGSDGTYAWAWPKQDLMVLFFTQSRGTETGIELESVIQRLLIKPDVEGYRRDMAAITTAEQSFERYQGLYWDEDVEDAYYVFSIEEDKLIMERPGRGRAVAAPTKEKGKFKIGRSLTFEFEDASDPAPAVLMTTRARKERQVRQKLNGNLPTIDNVISQVASAHGIDALKNSGVIMRSGTIKMGPLGMGGKIQQWFDGRNSRTEMTIGPRKILMIQNGDEVVATGISGSVERMEGIARHQEVLGHPAIEYGGWRRGYAQLDVLKRLKDKKTLLVRATAAKLPGATLIVDTESGLVVGAKRIHFVPGMGYVGLETRYQDFREVGGITLPFKIESKHSNAMIGKVVVSFDNSESGLETADLFELPDE